MNFRRPRGQGRAHPEFWAYLFAIFGSLSILGCASGQVVRGTAPDPSGKERPAVSAQASGPSLPPKRAPELALLDRPLCTLDPPEGAAPLGFSCSLVLESHAALAKGDGGGVKELIPRLDAALQESPNVPALLLTRGRLRAAGESMSFGEGGKGQAQALLDFERALELDPRSQVAELERARSLLSLGRGQEALPSLERLAETFQSDAEVQGAFGVCLLSLGRVREAKVSLERAALLRPEEAERRIALGTTYFLLGQSDRAEATFRAALHLRPELGRAHAGLGAVLLLAGRLEEGRAHLERALSLSPRNAAVLTNLAYADYLQGQLAESQRKAELATRIDPTLGSAWLNLSLALAAQKRFAEARDAIARAEALNPEDPRVKNALLDLREAEQGAGSEP